MPHMHYLKSAALCVLHAYVRNYWHTESVQSQIQNDETLATHQNRPKKCNALREKKEYACLKESQTASVLRTSSLGLRCSAEICCCHDLRTTYSTFPSVSIDGKVFATRELHNMYNIHMHTLRIRSTTFYTRPRTVCQFALTVVPCLLLQIHHHHSQNTTHSRIFSVVVVVGVVAGPLTLRFVGDLLLLRRCRICVCVCVCGGSTTSLSFAHPMYNLNPVLCAIFTSFYIRRG